MSEEEPERDIEFIAAYEDAQLRLACFHEARLIYPTAGIEELSKRAQEIYNWVMEVPEDEEEPASATPEETCEPRRH